MTQIRLKVTVRELVAFTMRSGDLFYRKFGGVTGLEGIRGHQRVQRARPSTYQAEVPVSCTHSYESFDLEIRGRIDGVDPTRNPILIEEIKTTRLDLEDLPEPARKMHFGQAQLYAYLYLLQESLSEAEVRLTYLNVDSGRTSTTSNLLSRNELESFFFKLTETYLSWAKRLHEWRQLRDTSLLALPFPFQTFRKGQRRFAAEVYRAIRDHELLFAQAPTGIGKSAATLYPALKALGENKFEVLFYLTAKTVGRIAAVEALNSLRDSGLKIKSLILTAKDKVCLKPFCNPDECERTKGYYDRIRKALDEAFERDLWNRTFINALAEKHRICPFELALDLTPWADCIVADYNYTFDPAATLRRFFGEERNHTTVLLVDEAHNLADRSRDMFSCELETSQFLQLANTLEDAHSTLAKVLRNFSRAFSCLKNKLELEHEAEKVLRTLPGDFVQAAHRFLQALEVWRTQFPDEAIPDELSAAILDVRSFTAIVEFFNERFAVICRSKDTHVSVKIYCLDAAEFLRSTLTKTRSAIFFSATLSPFPFHIRLLGGADHSRRLRLTSPFPRQHLKLLIAPHISTRYRVRNQSYAPITETIQTLISAKVGNYLIYFPSYAYLDKVFTLFATRHPEIRTLCQHSAMNEGEREQFLEAFQPNPPETLVGFAVMGGIFGEGVNLVGSRLIGVGIVGVGLPGLCLERDLIKAFFEDAKHLGFAYAYQYPGMNRVLQTSGRLIRNEADRGIVCLMDERFQQYRYRELFPPEWQPEVVNSTHQLRQAIDQFWLINPNPEP